MKTSWPRRAALLALTVAVSSVLASSGCSTAPSSGRGGGASGADQHAASPSETYGPPTPPGATGEAYGPPIPGNSQAQAPAPNAPVYGPEKIQYRPILLVLGPGMARGFAHVGVIRALHAANIPIAGIVGTEMGAFIASLYAIDGNLNHFEWSLQKFKEDEFGSGQGMVSKILEGEGRGGRFESDLSKVFGEQDLKSCKIPFLVGLFLNQGKGRTVYVGEGPITKAIRATMGFPGLLSPGKWANGPALAATRVHPFGITEARALTAGSVVVVDVSLPGQLSAAALPELHDADLVIRPQLKGIGAGDFSKRTDAAFRGQDAVQKEMKEIRHLVGLPEIPEPQEARQ